MCPLSSGCTWQCESHLHYQSAQPVLEDLIGELCNFELFTNLITFLLLGPLTATSSGATPAFEQSMVNSWGMLARTPEERPGPLHVTYTKSRNQLQI